MTPAPLSKRALAATIDGVVITALCAVLFLVPLYALGFVVPMWGVLVVLAGYSALPLAGLKQTLGMRALGVELVRPSGHAVDLVNVLFREMIGRGLFPAAYLFTLVAGALASLTGLGRTVAPEGITGVMAWACVAVVALALAGSLTALSRPDKRTLADLMSGSLVVEAPALPLPTDADELDEHRAHRRRIWVRIVTTQAVLLAATIALPWLFMVRTSESPREKVARLKLETLEAKFRAAPQDNALARELTREYRNQYREEDARRIDDAHRAAISGREAERELSLREAFEKDPRRRDLAESLIGLLEEQDRVDEAEVVYRQYLGDAPAAHHLAGFGNWLASNGRNDAAIVELNRAIAMDPLVAYGHTLLGVALARAGRMEEAREHLTLAVLDDAEDETAADALEDVVAQVGPLDGKQRKALEQRIAAWKADAGL